MERRPARTATDTERAGEHDPCERPWERSLLPLYVLSHCGEEEALAFEAHLLGCETCFQDVRSLDRARVLIREFTGPSSPVRDRVRRALGASRVGLGDVAGRSRMPGSASRRG